MPVRQPPSFFTLPAGEQRDLLQQAVYHTPWNAKVLEKDIWVVWALDALFRQPDAPKYAFKGGTCLSKAFRAIYRFSEDVDVTINPDHPTLLEGLDPTELGISKTQLKNRGDRARAKLTEYLGRTLVPYLQGCAGQLPSHAQPRIELEDLTEGHIRVRYASALDRSPAPPYMAESVLLEFGVRASPEPTEIRSVVPYLAELDHLRDRVLFPGATVDALKLERTFWEKATLIHFENTRADRPVPAERYARHWYDLHTLAQRPGLIDDAIARRDILRHVLHVKQTHYGGKGVSYKDCGSGRLRLRTAGSLRSDLERDYDQMIEAGMFVQSPPTFAAIVDQLATLETTINARLEGDPVEV